MKKRFFSVMGSLLPLLFPLGLLAQSFIIKGLVTNAATKQPLGGALVLAKHHNKACMAGAAGNYHLVLQAADTLVVSCKGFQTLYLPIGPKKLATTLPIRLTPTLARPVVGIKPLSIGDAFPDTTLGAVWHHPMGKGHFKDLRGKAVLLDFFATWCSACVQSLPKLDSLQAIYGQQLQVILVAYQPLKQVQAFFQQHPSLPMQRIWVITGDSVLSKYFPHRFIPHVVWVGKSGNIDAITDGMAISSANVKHWLAGNTLHLPLKKDMVHYDAHETLADNAGLGTVQQALVTGTTLARLIPGLGSREGVYTANGFTRYSYINRPVLVLYQKLFGFDNNRVVLAVNQPERYTNVDADTKAWEGFNLYSFETIVPATTPDSLVKQNMVATLNQALGLQAHMAVKPMSVWVLSKLPAFSENLLQPPLTATAAVDADLYETFTDKPMALLLDWLNAAKIPTDQAPIIVDETGITTKVSLHISKLAMGNIPLLQAALAPYGLGLVQATRPLSVFVLSHANTTNY